MRLDILFSAGVARVRAQEEDSTHGPDFILNVMTLPQTFKRHSDRARIPSYCCKKNQRERERERELKKKKERERSAVTSAVESRFAMGHGGGLKVREKADELLEFRLKIRDSIFSNSRFLPCPM